VARARVICGVANGIFYVLWDIITSGHKLENFPTLDLSAEEKRERVR